MMTECLDRVRIALSRSEVVISWAALEALLERLEGVGGAGRIIDEFRNAGTSRPIMLNAYENALLSRIVGNWVDEVGWVDAAGEPTAPAGVHELRNALEDERSYGVFD